MAKVPDTDAFGALDVKASLEGYSVTGYIYSIIDNGLGKSRFLVSGGTQKLAVESNITISNTVMHNGPHTITALSVGNWFETGSPYYGSTDTGNWDVDLKSQIALFDWANSSYFDIRYSGSKDRQSNFRNYGSPGTGLLTVGDHEDQAGYHWGLHGNEHWIFVACMEFGVRCYDVSTLGILDLKNTALAPGNEQFIDVWTQSSKLFLTSSDGVADVNYLRSYTYNTTTGVMAIADVIQSSNEPGTHHIFGDGTNLIFVTQPFGYDTYGIRSYTYDVDGNLDYKATYSSDSAFYHKGVYADGHLFVVGSNGITSFLRNTSTGVLTRVDNDNTGTFVGNSIIYDSSNGLLYVGSNADGAIVYSHSSGVLTQEYSQGSGLRKHPAYHPAANYLYYIDGSNVHRYKRNVSDDLDYIGSQALGIVERLFVWSEAPNILICADGYDGIRTYLIDYD